MNLLLTIWSFANCFLGYVIFRILVAVYGALLGAGVGFALLVRFRPDPRPLDFVVACGVCGILLGLLAWFLYRAAFAILAGLAALGGVLTALNASAAGWILGVLAGLILAGVTFAWLRYLVMILTGVGGALGGTYSLAAAFAGGRPALHDALAGSVPLTIVLVLIAAVLAALGIAAQIRLSEAVGATLTPAPGRKRSRGRSRTVAPPFTRL